MQLQEARPAGGPVSRRTPRGDRVMQGLIAGGGVAVLLMLAWAHLGLSALLFAPPATPPHMAAAAGPYVVTLHADSGQLVIGDANTVSLDVRGRDGRSVTHAQVRVHADMTTMAMPVPDVTATAQSDGRYHARLIFSMAGPWRLTVTIAAPGQLTTQVAFEIGVRWR